MNSAIQTTQNTGLVVASINTGVTKSNNVFVKALANSRPIFELQPIEKKNLLADCIGTATFIAGWSQKSDSDILLMVGILLPKLNTKYVRFTEGEIKTAFELGAEGHYGENKAGMSPATCIGWLNNYQQDTNRANAKLELERSKKPKVILRPSRGMKRNLIRTAYKEYFEKGSYNDIGNGIYDMLDAERLINFTPDQKTTYLERGRKIVYDRLQVWRDLQEKKENERKLSDLIESDTTAIIEAKKLALIDLFESYKTPPAICDIPFINGCLQFKYIKAA